MDPLGVLLCGAFTVLVLLLVGSCLLRANRLDRLHVRTDAARAALFAALERRAVVARAAAVLLDDQTLLATAARTETVPATEREAAENDLGKLLGDLPARSLPEPLRAELTDAEQRVMLARRVHNDAVRDTLALRSRRLVRWLRLAGTAPVPGYFEIAEVDAPADGPAEPPPRSRRAGRVVLLDSARRVLLFEGVDPARPGSRSGSPRAAARCRARTAGRRPAGSWPRRPGCGCRWTVWSGRCGGGTPCSASTAGTWPPTRSSSCSPPTWTGWTPRGSPTWSGAPCSVTAGGPPRNCGAPVRWSIRGSSGTCWARWTRPPGTE